MTSHAQWFQLPPRDKESTRAVVDVGCRYQIHEQVHGKVNEEIIADETRDVPDAINMHNS